jgi:hypothetical protein
MRKIKKILTQIYRTWPNKGTRWFSNFLGAPMIYNAKSLFIAVNVSLNWLNNG